MKRFVPSSLARSAGRSLIGTALVGTFLIAPSVTGQSTPFGLAAHACELSASHAKADPPRDPDEIPEESVIAEQRDEGDRLDTEYENNELPADELNKAPDDTLHAQLADGSVQVQVFVHVIHDGATGDVSETDVRKQIGVLNDTFAAESPSVPTAFTFQLAGVDDADNAEWFAAVVGGSAETEMKNALHVGDADTLNVYLNHLGAKEPGDGGYLGYATFPWLYQNAPDQDGVVLNYMTLPGGAAADLNEGKILGHEVGHWLGLLHTFQGGCDAPGDEVDDTPAEADPASGCPAGQDSCPAAGTDPVHNNMDYRLDACRDQFTAGQAQRLDDFWAAFRQSRESA
jgi:hypothetical protein